MVVADQRLEGDHCLAHLTDSEFTQALQRLRDGRPLDARGVEVTVGRLRELLRGLQTDDRPQVPVASFEDARFVGGDIHFERTRFVGDVQVNRAQFCTGDGCFEDARFCGDAHFDSAQFRHTANHRRVQR